MKRISRMQRSGARTTLVAAVCMASALALFAADANGRTSSGAPDDATYANSGAPAGTGNTDNVVSPGDALRTTSSRSGVTDRTNLSSPVATSTSTSTGADGVTRSSGQGPARARNEAGVRFSWGKPAVVHSFNEVKRWEVYDNGAKLDYGLRRASQVKTGDGVLTIAATPAGLSGGLGDSVSQKYGAWETRMRATSDGKCWRPVLLLWPSDDSLGEIDYAENLGGGPNNVNFVLHFGPDGDDTRAGKKIDQTKWHNYAVRWTPTSITGYVDGVKFFEDRDPAHIPDGTFHATIQLDSMAQDQLCSATASMHVDWMKIYRYKNGPITTRSM